MRGFRLSQTAPARFRLELAAREAAAVPTLAALVVAALQRLGWTAPEVEPGPLAPATGEKPEPFRRLPFAPARHAS